jgi:hypothetical protein
MFHNLNLSSVPYMPARGPAQSRHVKKGTRGYMKFTFLLVAISIISNHGGNLIGSDSLSDLSLDTTMS